MILDVNQQTTEWHELRMKSIGASDAPIIMQVSPWKTPFQLWEQKLGLSMEAGPLPHQEEGLRLEEIVREKIKIEHGYDLKPAVFRNKDYPWMICSLDGWDENQKMAVEIKCPNQIDHHSAKLKEVPKKYFPQVQHQMMTIGLEKMLYCSFDKHNIEIFEVYKDEKYCEILLEKEKKFLECVKSMTVPELSFKDCVYRTDFQWIELSERYHELMLEKTLLAFEEAKIKEKLISLSENRNTRGGKLLVSKVVKKGNVNYSNIPELRNVDLEKYRNEPITYWRVSTE